MMSITLKTKIKFAKTQNGATMIEYAIMVAFIAIIVMVGAGALGQKTNAFFVDAVNKFPSTG